MTVARKPPDEDPPAALFGNDRPLDTPTHQIIRYRERRLGLIIAGLILLSVLVVLLVIAIVTPALIEPWIVGAVLTTSVAAGAGMTGYYTKTFFKNSAIAKRLQAQQPQDAEDDSDA